MINVLNHAIASRSMALTQLMWWPLRKHLRQLWTTSGQFIDNLGISGDNLGISWVQTRDNLGGGTLFGHSMRWTWGQLGDYFGTIWQVLGDLSETIWWQMQTTVGPCWKDTGATRDWISLSNFLWWCGLKRKNVLFQYFYLLVLTNIWQSSVSVFPLVSGSRIQNNKAATAQIAPVKRESLMILR